MKIKYQIILGCCLVFICTVTVFGQNRLNRIVHPNAYDYLQPIQTNANPYVIDFSVDCGGGFTSAHHKGDKIQSLSAIDDSSANECARLRTVVHELDQSGLYKMENDSGRHYIETCAIQKGSAHVFVDIDGAVQFMNDDNNRWLDYRTWLKKVLYLSLDTAYYCADASSIMGTFAYLIPGHGIDYNGVLSVADYLLQNNRCPDFAPNWLKLRKGTRDKQVQIWRDSVKDSTKTPLDTSGVTLESMNLQILKGQQFAVTPSPSTNKGNTILSFIATKNPFNDATALRYELSEASALRLEIYDLLGRQVYSEGEGIMEAGGHQIQLDGKLFSSGTYYARLTTLGGEVRTITLKHF